MITLDSSVVRTPRLNNALGVCDVSPGTWDVLLSTQGCDWGLPGLQVDVSTVSQNTSVMRVRGILDRGTSLSSASCYMTLSQVNSDLAFGSEDHIPSVPGLGQPFSASDNNPPFSSLVQEPDCSRCIWRGPENWLGRALTNAPMSHSNYEVATYRSLSTPSATPRTIHPYPLSSSFNQDTEGKCETSGSSGLPPMDFPHQYSGGAEPAAILNQNYFSEFEAWIDSSSAFGEISQMVDFKSLPLSTHLPLGQHLDVSEEAVYRCEWINEIGAVCGGELSRSTLSGHLSMHGIKSMSRDKPTKCKWVGCRREKSMNRESIARHVREVHLRVKRFPKCKNPVHKGTAF